VVRKIRVPFKIFSVNFRGAEIRLPQERGFFSARHRKFPYSTKSQSCVNPNKINYLKPSSIGGQSEKHPMSFFAQHASACWHFLAHTARVQKTAAIKIATFGVVSCKKWPQGIRPHRNDGGGGSL
jgi:hypothetical protein